MSGHLTTAARTALLSLALLAALVAGGQRATRAQDAPRWDAAAPAAQETGAIVVRARRLEDLDALAAAAASEGYTLGRRVDDLKALHLTPPGGVSVEQAQAAFAGRPGVLYVEPVLRMFRTADVPADPLWARQSPYLTAEYAPQAWDVEKGKAEVLVAVIDTGIDVGHPDLQGRIWRNPLEVPNNAVDEDNNGCIDDVNGCAFVRDASPGCSRALNGFIRDDLGHGTFVSGVIAANGNSSGMVGVARGVTVMAVKILDCSGGGDSFALAEGISYAAKNGAHVMNISLGGPNDSAIVREAVRKAHDDHNVVLVAASGNSGTEGVSYPAKYPGVLAVGASSAANPKVRAKFSTTGPEIGVVAVGEKVVGTVPKATCGVFLKCIGSQPYAVGSGTSFAAPQVAGLAALILSRSRGLDNDQVVANIKTTAQKVQSPDTPRWAGSGLIHMLNALRPQYRLGAPGLTRN